jgi:hypothetical protein
MVTAAEIIKYLHVKYIGMAGLRMARSIQNKLPGVGSSPVFSNTRLNLNSSDS